MIKLFQCDNLQGRDATPYLERNRVGRDAIDAASALTDMGKYLFLERRLPVYDIAVAITKLDMCRWLRQRRTTLHWLHYSNRRHWVALFVRLSLHCHADLEFLHQQHFYAFIWNFSLTQWDVNWKILLKHKNIQLYYDRFVYIDCHTNDSRLEPLL